MVVIEAVTFSTSLPCSSLPGTAQSSRIARPGTPWREGAFGRNVCRFGLAAYAEEATPSPEARRGGQALEEASAVEARAEGDAVEGMQEYVLMKSQLMGRAKRGAGFLSIYIFLQQGLVAGACAALGSLAAYAYLRLIVWEVDRYTEDTDVPLMRAQEIQTQPLRALAIGFAAYRQAITPRLLIPLSLGLLVFGVNSNLEENFSGMQQFDMLVGFLFTYKAGLFLKLYDDLKPKFGKDADARPARPTLASLPDIEEDRMERLLRERKRH